MLQWTRKFERNWTFAHLAPSTITAQAELQTVTTYCKERGNAHSSRSKTSYLIIFSVPLWFCVSLHYAPFKSSVSSDPYLVWKSFFISLLFLSFSNFQVLFFSSDFLSLSLVSHQWEKKKSHVAQNRLFLDCLVFRSELLRAKRTLARPGFSAKLWRCRYS